VLGQIAAAEHLAPDVVVNGPLRNDGFVVVFAVRGHGFERSRIPAHFTAELRIRFARELRQEAQPLALRSGHRLAGNGVATPAIARVADNKADECSVVRGNGLVAPNANPVAFV